MNKPDKTNLIHRAEHLIKNNHGVLYKSCISILKTGLRMARETQDFSDLKEFVPKFEEKHIKMKLQIEKENLERKQKTIQDITHLFKSYTKEMLFNQLEKCKKESMELMEKWSRLRRDERTQRKATISNRADSNAKEMVLIQDAITYMGKNKLTRI
ncbi:MAG: hypothetical protein V3V33_11660 [Candidatus Lokiarchaeia archaeon]